MNRRLYRPFGSTVRVLLFLTVFAPLRGHAADQPTGLYTLTNSGISATTIGGQTYETKHIHLGSQLRLDSLNAIIRSLRNGNEKYVLSLTKHGDIPKDAPFMALCITGSCITFSREAVEAGPVDREISEDEAESFAKLLGISLQKRNHPGYAIRTRFLPAKSIYSKTDPIVVAAEICNVGERPFTFLVGGHGREARDDQYHFIAYGGGPVPDVGKKSGGLGGLAGAETLKPSECYKNHPVDLEQWFSFKKAGEYYVFGAYDLQFTGAQDFEIIWEDSATAWFNITVQ